MSYLHVSFDPVEEFIPRIPEMRLPNEDFKVKRICVSDTIKHCLAAIPAIEDVADSCIQHNYDPIIHVYNLIPQDGSVINTKSLGEKELVPDAWATHEMWLTKSPVKVIRADYRWLNARVDIGFNSSLNYEVFKIEGLLQRIKKTDESADLVKKWFDPTEIEYQRLYPLFKKYGVKQFLEGCPPDDLKRNLGKLNIF